MCCPPPRKIRDTMKKSILISALLTASFASVLQAANTYYFTKNSSVNMDDVANWYTDENLTQKATSFPEEGANVVFGKTSLGNLTFGDKSFVFGDMTILSAHTGNISLRAWNTAAVENYDSLLLTGDLNIEAVSAKREIVITRCAGEMKNYNSRSLEVTVNGDINVGNGNILKMGFNNYYNSSNANKYLYVGGDVNVNASTLATEFYVAATYFDASRNSPNVDINGKLNMSSGDVAAKAILFGGSAWMNNDQMALWLANDYDKRTFVRIGGLQGKGELYGSNTKTKVSNDLHYQYTINLEIANTTSDSVFEGRISKAKTDSGNVVASDITLNIVKSGLKKQTIIATNAVDITSISVEEGELALANTSGSFGKISLDGGAISATLSDSDIGEFTADSIIWNTGTINVDINGDTSDKIFVNNFTKGEGDVFKFIFNEDSENKILTGNEYVIAQVDGTFGFEDSDFTYSAEGYLANFNFNEDDRLLYVTFTAVPEPATIAGIFGVLALAFVAYRRRK